MKSHDSHYTEVVRTLIEAKFELTLDRAKLQLALCLSEDLSPLATSGYLIELLCAHVEAGNDIQRFREAIYELNSDFHKSLKAQKEKPFTL